MFVLIIVERCILLNWIRFLSVILILSCLLFRIFIIRVVVVRVFLVCLLIVLLWFIWMFLLRRICFILWLRSLLRLGRIFSIVLLSLC